jgi:acetate kinase
MGMTPAGGLVMSTRAGDVDPCAVTYVMRRDGLSPDDMDRLLTTHSGLAALAGTGDMRTLLAREAEDPRAKAAIDVFCYQAAKWIGAFAAALGGLDTLVFSGGIGEQAPDIRARILERVVFLGITLDDAANRRHAPVISSAVSRIAVRVIPTDEALVMARQARAVLTPSQENFHD